jgi:hypothetical protein
MNPQPKTSAKDFFLNLGAIVALYTTIISLLNLLFTVINKAFPQIVNYYYTSSSSISMPVATLIIFFPVYILLMWSLEKSYLTEPEKRNLGVRKWLTYITLFIAGLVLAGDLVTVLYYFLDGQEMTAGFLLKVLAVLLVVLGVFVYYISDIREKLSSRSRKIWAVISLVVILISIIWGFTVLGSPRTQQLYKYDEQKVSDLQNLNYQVQDYYQLHSSLPVTIDDLCGQNSLSPNNCVDKQTGKKYEYVMTGQSAKTYQLCAIFNKDSNTNDSQVQTYPYVNGQSGWVYSAGHYCFDEVIPASQYKPVSAVAPLK